MKTYRKATREKGTDELREFACAEGLGEAKVRATALVLGLATAAALMCANAAGFFGRLLSGESVRQFSQVVRPQERRHRAASDADSIGAAGGWIHGRRGRMNLR